MRKFLLIAGLVIAAVSCGTTKVQEYKVKVVREYPHDVTSYTQGLFFYRDSLYESTGQWGESTFRTVDLETGKALSRMDFSRKYFIEGSIFFEGTLYLLTWTNNLVFLYDADTRKYRETVAYPREGWGLTTDGKQLIASDGSSFLYFMDRREGGGDRGLPGPAPVPGTDRRDGCPERHRRGQEGPDLPDREVLAQDV